MATVAANIIAFALQDVGKMRYSLGAKPPLDGDLPPAGTKSDCSGAVRRWAHRGGVDMPDGSYIQHQWALAHGHEVPVGLARGPHGAGCLLFINPQKDKPGHVAISLGNGKTVECRGHVGSCVVDAKTNAHRGWDAAVKADAFFEDVT